MLGELLRDGGVPPGVQVVALTGEAGSDALVERLRAAGVPVVRNLYGPTEATVFATGCTMPAAGTGRPWPLGEPGPGVRVRVVGPDGRLVPRGVEGELAIGGDGVGDGYPGRAALTAQRFVPDPYPARPGARLYLTGDRARWSSDGVLEYLGRRDHQVKIRGQRVELGEIEQVLATHPAVSAVYVVVLGEAPAQRLVAYVRPATRQAPAAKELSAFAERKLPAGWVPSAYVVLDEIPLTASGKVDRLRLPEPAEQERSDGTAVDARTPWTALERTLSGIWAEVLGLPTVDRQDNLFLLGGHSLSILRIRHRIAESVGHDVPVADFFAHPTVAELAARLAAGGPSQEPSA
ncbi:non-ribosomal peptide synthetase [Streptacidiphilus sp. 4-A2]|nr:non-ribosomal peptide synthetase [Streptacidiphilus sp. 4-A2]